MPVSPPETASDVNIGGYYSCLIFLFKPPLLPVYLPGDQCQETIPAGSCATSSQEDHPQTGADRGAEAGDQGGLWTIWHRWIWIYRCQGAQGKSAPMLTISFQGVSHPAVLSHTAPGRDESPGLWTEEGGDQKDDKRSGQGWNWKNLLHWLPRRHDSENGRFVAPTVFHLSHRK